MPTVLVQLALVGLVSAVVWKTFQIYARRSSLDNIPGPTSNSWLGILPQLFAADAWKFHDELTERYGRVVRLQAMFKENQLYVSDPVALHHIIVKDQYVYEETSAFIQSCRLFFGRGLLATLGDEHKKQRNLLNPVFSTGHIRGMHPICTQLCKKMCDAIANRIKDGPQEVDMLSWMSRFALELVGQCGFGYSFDNLREDEAAHPFCVASKALTPALQPLMLLRNYALPYVNHFGPPAFRRFILDFIPWKSLHTLRDIVDTYTQTADDIYDSKRKAFLEGDETVSRQVEMGKDMLSVLMRANMDASEGERLSEAELKGQIVTLCFAGTDTTSTALARALQLLSQNQATQCKLRDVVRAAHKEAELTYDALIALPYLDAVCKETLRLYPPVPVVLRTARRDIVLPLGTPIRGVNGEAISEIPISSSTDIMVSIIAINRDPMLWGDDAHEWKPERWLKPLPETVRNAHIPGIYANQLTFLGGARSCIGMQFSQLEMKVALSMLVERYEFSQSKEIVWQMNSIVSPTVRDEPGPSLPLMVAQAT